MILPSAVVLQMELLVSLSTAMVAGRSMLRERMTSTGDQDPVVVYVYVCVYVCVGGWVAMTCVVHNAVSEAATATGDVDEER